MRSATDAPTPPKINQTYLDNMAVLWRQDPWLALIVDECADAGEVLVEPSRSGPPTARVRRADGRAQYLHSRYDPVAEAARLAATVPLEDHFCFIVAGFGLGYHVRALRERLRGESVIVVLEPHVEFLRAALENVDLRDLFQDGRVICVTSADKGLLHERLQAVATRMLIGTHIVVHPPSQQFDRAGYQEILGAVTDYVAYAKTSLVTLVANARITCQNVCFNLPTMLATPPIDIVRNRFAGYPAIIIAAGPSLRRNLHLLSAARGRAVLIAVQTVFRTLLRAGIVPDFVTSLDYHEISRRFFEDIDDFAEVHLIAEPKATWHVLDIYRGPISLLANEYAELVLQDALPRREGLKAGATVAHLAFYLAEYLGCDPIIFVGQDLAMTDGVYYAPGAGVHDAWWPELNRFYSIESKEWERIVRYRRVLRKVPDIRGEEVYTEDHLFTYLQQFEADFARTRARVIDATEGGARKAGTTIMPLGEALRRFAREPIPAECFAYRQSVRWFDPSLWPAARRALRQRITEVRELRDLCRQTVAVLTEMKDLLRNPREFNRRMSRVDELRAKVRQRDIVYGIITSVSQLAELRKFAADLRLAADDTHEIERARRQLDRDIEFVNSLIEGANELEEIFTRADERFDEVARLRGLPEGIGQ